jgi:hypothetical protein
MDCLTAGRGDIRAHLDAMVPTVYGAWAAIGAALGDVIVLVFVWYAICALVGAESTSEIGRNGAVITESFVNIVVAPEALVIGEHICLSWAPCVLAGHCDGLPS